MTSATTGLMSVLPMPSRFLRHSSASASRSFHVLRKNHQSAGKRTSSTGMGTTGLIVSSSDDPAGSIRPGH